MKRQGGTGAGNRLKAVRNGVTTKYVYDAAGNLLAEADSSGAITQYYIHGAGLIALKPQGDGVYCYHFDATGNTVALTDQSGSIANTYAYKPFGEMTQGQTQTITQPFTYVGQYGVMAEPYGYYYMRARYYDSASGRFVSEDPLGFGGGDVNLYAYVRANPIMFVDPLGLCANSLSNRALNWAGRVFEGSRIGSGVGASMTASVGVVSANVGYSNVRGNQVSPGGIASFEEEKAAANIKIGSMVLGYESINGATSPSGRFQGRYGVEISSPYTLELGATIPVPSASMQAVDWKIKMNLVEMFR